MINAASFNSKSKSQNQKKRSKGGWYNVWVLVGIPFVHLDVFASDEKETEMTVVVPDLIRTQMIDLSEILKRASSSSFSPTATAAAASTFIEIPPSSQVPWMILLRSVPGNHFLRPRRCHRLDSAFFGSQLWRLVGSYPTTTIRSFTHIHSESATLANFIVCFLPFLRSLLNHNHTFKLIFVGN